MIKLLNVNLTRYHTDIILTFNTLDKLTNINDISIKQEILDLMEKLKNIACAIAIMIENIKSYACK